MARSAPCARDQAALSESSKELEMPSFNGIQSVLTVETAQHDAPDEKQIQLAKEIDRISDSKKSSFKGQNSITAEAEKRSSVTMETGQHQTDVSGNIKKRSSVNVETMIYEAQESDTLLSISAHFDMAPSELKQLNKLMSSQIYTKQKLLIYAKNFLEAEEREKARKLAEEENLRNSGFSDGPRSRHGSAAGHDLVRLRRPSGRQDDLPDGVSEKSVDRIVSDIKKNRLRMEAKHVTDGQGVVSGTLLVTTNTIMFDPNVSDRLVIDRGRNPYVMVAPFENVVRLAIVDDIAAMKWQRNTSVPPPNIYYGEESCVSIEEAPGPDEIMLSPDSTSEDPNNKSESPMLKDAHPSVNDQMTVNGLKGEEDSLIVSDGQKMTDSSTLDGRYILETSWLNDVCDHSSENFVNNDENTEKLIMRNRENLCTGSLENSPRPGLFAQRCASNSLFPDALLNGVTSHPSSVPKNYPATIGSPVVPADLSYEVGKFFARRQSVASSLGERRESFVGKQPSLSNVVDSGLGTPSKFVPVYSAKCIPRIASNLQKVDSMGSFCIPPGQNYIVDLTWDQFGGMKVEDGFCVSIYDLPPIVDEDARLMEKPDFFISDDEDADVVPDVSKESENPNRKSSEVDVIKLLKSTDELYKSLNVLIPRPASHYEDLPWYLCVVIGHPLPNRSSKGPTSPYSYSVENMRPNYWFSIHRCDVQPLYEFIMTHFPNIYGSEDEINPADRGLMILSQDVFKSKQEASSVCQFFLDEEEDYQTLPSFSEESKILEASQIAKLNGELFPRGKDCYWKLVYSDERDGTSLQTLYRKMMELSDHDPPCVVVIRDSSRTVFGVALTCTIKRSHEYFGNGESFLFSFKDGFKKYSGSCINDYYAYGYKDSLCFGASRGSCGLWIDGDLHHGRSQECATYGNDVLTMTEDFYIHQLEAWCLI